YYNYIEGKKRVEEILNNQLEVKKENKIPKDENFTYSNAYYGWVTGIFVDIRDSSELFFKEDKELVSKMIRSFTSEIIEILRDDDNLREIGIRGDCVYAIYTTPTQDDIYEVVDKAILIHTFLKMLHELFDRKKTPKIQAGIGIASAEELVVKAGRKGVGINNSVWIGDAVTKASNLSSLGAKNGYKPIIISEITYNNIIDIMAQQNEDKDVKSWFNQRYTYKFGTFYDSYLIKTNFDNWIDNGMK
ncbi:MAG: hypothetical protein JXQ76_09795, partial [Campylobacterales bacterium]|nr:hypothetical protein [Campylobacterales bacterium]